MLTIHPGHTLHTLRLIPDASVQCVVTSPPYWGLRDYGTDPVRWPEVNYIPMPGLPCQITAPAGLASLGLEPTLHTFIGHLVAIFREVHRVLKPDGCCWVNMGDGYNNTDKWGGGQNTGKHTKSADGSVPSFAVREKRAPMPGLKPKDLIGQPWQLAFALQADGWFLRQDIIWAKPNPMPESTQDRCTKAHEYLFLLTKSGRYYWDKNAMQEQSTCGHLPGNLTHKGLTAYESGDGKHRTKQGLVAYSSRMSAKSPVPAGWDTGAGNHGTIHKAGSRRNSFARGGKNSTDEMGQKPQFRPEREPLSYEGTRNKRSVWSIPTAPFKEAHFATFPPDLVRPCILASTRLGDTVLDPFGGSFTTGLVALELGRHAIMCELNPDYIEIGKRRCDPANITPAML